MSFAQSDVRGKGKKMMGRIRKAFALVTAACMIAGGSAVAGAQAQPLTVAAGRPVSVLHARPYIGETIGMYSFEILKDGKPVGDGELTATGQIVRAGASAWEICVPGDVTGDGKCTLADLQKAVSMIRKGSAPGNVFEQAADANGDGRLTSTDLVQIAAWVQSKTDGMKEPVWHAGRRQTVWVPAEDASRIEPVYAAKNAQICNSCRADITGREGEHSWNHVLAGEAAGFHLERIYAVTGYENRPEAHLQTQLVCNTCGLNVTEAGIDPEAHRDEHAQRGDMPGGFAEDSYDVRLVHVFSAAASGGHYETQKVSDGWWE